MAYMNRPWAVDPSDYKFQHNGVWWCVSMEFEEMDDGYTPVLWALQGNQWTAITQFGALHFSQDIDQFKARYGSPAGYLQRLADTVTAKIKASSDTPLPTPGNPVERSVYHTHKSLQWDGEKLVIKMPLVP